MPCELYNLNFQSGPNNFGKEAKSLATSVLNVFAFKSRIHNMVSVLRRQDIHPTIALREDLLAGVMYLSSGRNGLKGSAEQKLRHLKTSKAPIKRGGIYRFCIQWEYIWQRKVVISLIKKHFYALNFINKYLHVYRHSRPYMGNNF